MHALGDPKFWSRLTLGSVLFNSPASAQIKDRPLSIQPYMISQ